MTEQMIFDRIVVSRDVLHGKPHISGTRVMVVQVLDLLAAGKSPADVISEDYFPDLTEDDVRACIAFASQMIRDDRIVSSA
ncbi:MAG: DUF433 domain-containing protein [Chloroflexi bacterium]|nr:DUF433 domain-containing protein [Chloroflexota bacterium]